MASVIVTQSSAGQETSPVGHQDPRSFVGSLIHSFIPSLTQWYDFFTTCSGPEGQKVPRSFRPRLPC